MVLQSMTGFARSEGVRDDLRWFWELRSVNGRGLDLRLRVPQGYGEVDVHARERLQATLTRGTVHANLQVQDNEQAPGLYVNEEVLDRLLAEAARLQRAHGLEPARVDGLLALRGVLELREPSLSASERDGRLGDLRAGFDRALDDLMRARETEGATLCALLRDHLAVIERGVERAAAASARAPEAMRQRLRQQVERLMDGAGPFDENRLYQEALLLAAKADIQEEIDRLRAHLASARALLKQGGPVGRRLDFLAQELSREGNTLCAKAGDAELSVIGIELKAVIDQFREQVQNLE